jgi:hypothetical protein
VSLASLTPERVRLATTEFDELGRLDFLRKYQFSKAKSYFLELDGKLYDSKAIVGRALGLSSSQFSGGDATVARRLETLGFQVLHFPQNPWKREEIILACAAVESNHWKQPANQNDWRIVEISELLQTTMFYPLDQHGPDFRNPGAVSRKMANIVTSRPDYRGAPTRGNHLDGEVATDFIEQPAKMHAEAARLRAVILGHNGSTQPGPESPLENDGRPVVFDVPIEAHYTVQYQTRPRTDSATATRHEAELVMRYQRWSRTNGYRVTGKSILLPGRKNPLRVDLYDLDNSELIEAKASTERDTVRLALGQILDYARYVPHERRAVLLPNRPDADLVDLLSSHAISCIFETSDDVFERIDTTPSAGK